ncbi:arabinose isomerase [Neolewinella antarctica]|uniref:L-arabinose isomerase n=1 Tax=Neolewinella antarctica TaxID=442734 RepID=A0ABX0XES7_9BACT|nr:arabinose isomerase [Neolewinella antarctica]NJC27620.1 L-arabinose isomerase [Neolewinella antarctica]
MQKPSLNVALCGIGLAEYWPQFPGLETRLQGYLQTVADRIAAADHARIIPLGLVDSIDKSFAAGRRCRREEADLIVIYVTTYALSATVLPLVRQAGVPVIVLNVAPLAAIDYLSFNAIGDRGQMTGEWLAYCSACPVPEIGNVFQRAGIPFHQVTGLLAAQDPCWTELADWIEAAYVQKVMAFNRLGAMGHYYGGMLDIYTDTTQQLITFGGHLEIIEVDELTGLRREVTEREATDRVAEFRTTFAVQSDCSAAELTRAARTSVALDRLVDRYQLGSLAYYYKGTGVPENEDTMSSIIIGNSLLTAAGVPVAGEYEIKNAQAMKIMDTFGVGGSFTEFYAMDFADDVVLMGHDGPGHLTIAAGKIKVKPLTVYHGKVGRGLSVEMSVRPGPVTLLSVVEDREHGLKLLVAEGHTEAGPILEIGNTNSRYRFTGGVRAFVNDWNAAGPAHHCAVGVGHIGAKLHKLAALLGITCQQVR